MDTWVYPRSRGAAIELPPGTIAALGLSPLARGSLQASRPGPTPRGSIPARAGQPAAGGVTGKVIRVYPRSRGAALTQRAPPSSNHGLSPLARGSHSTSRRHTPSSGSIPARAGQPSCAAPIRPGGGVYPRSRGAACGNRARTPRGRGLSPLARGSPTAVRRIYPWPGSIPARAGQPSPPSGRSSDEGVYPRSRGAAGAAEQAIGGVLGLSPLARGSRRH